MAGEGVLENVASLESSKLSPGILNTCFCVEIRNTWPLKTAHGSVCFPECRGPLNVSIMQVQERRADGGCGSGRPELTVPKCFGILSLSRATGWIAAGATGKRRSSPELFAWFLCVLQSFFRQVLFTYRSELKEQLCSRRDRKQGPVWEGPAWD